MATVPPARVTVAVRVMAVPSRDVVTTLPPALIDREVLVTDWEKARGGMQRKASTDASRRKLIDRPPRPMESRGV
jgi:hypothetical protein